MRELYGCLYAIVVLFMGAVVLRAGLQLPRTNSQML